MKRTLIILFLLANISLVFSQYKVIEKISKQKNEFKIAESEGLLNYTKYELQNGLTVIINENHTDPVVSVNVGYRFGSGNDQGDFTGISYLTFKLMQSGSKHIGKGWYENYIKQFGGQFSANITQDYTTFISTVPKNLLETVLWAESDRMACLLDSVTNDKFVKVREEVKSYSQDKTFNGPYGPIENNTINSLYLYGYPYSWPVYGVPDHIASIDLYDFMKYFLDWYGPNNAVIVISGDVNEDIAVKLVNKYFGNISKCTNSKPHQNPYSASTILLVDNSLSQNRYVTYEYDINKPLLRIVFPSVPRYDSKEIYFSLLANLLAGDTSSVLSHALINEKLALSVNAYQSSSLLTGNFIIDITSPQDTHLSRVKIRAEEIINSFFKKINTKQQISEPKFDRFFMAYKMNFYKSLETSKDIVNNFFTSEVFYGNPNLINKNFILNNYSALLAPLQIAINQFISNKPALYISVVPYNQTNLSAENDNYKPMVLSSILTHTKKTEISSRNMPMAFNRKIPAIKKLKNLTLPASEVKKFDNGLTLITIPDNKFPIATIKIYIDIERINPQYSNYYPGMFSELLKNLFFDYHNGENRISLSQSGSQINFYSEGNKSIIEFQTSSQNVFFLREAFIHLFREPVLSDQGDIKSIIRNIQNEFNPNTVQEMSTLIYRNLAFHTKNAEGPVTASGEESFGYLSDLILNIQDIFNPSNFTIAITGNYEEPMLEAFIEPFKNWVYQKQNNTYVLNNTFMPGQDSGKMEVSPEGCVFFLDNVNIKSPQIITGLLNFPVLSQNFYQNEFYLETVKKVINDQVYNKEFLSYFFLHNSFDYIHSEIIPNLLFMASEVNNSSIDTGFKKIIYGAMTMKDINIDKKELKKLKTWYFYKGLVNRESGSQKADLMFYITKNKLDNNYYSYRDKKIKKIKNNQFSDIIKTNFDRSKISALVVGNKIKLSDWLSKIHNIDGMNIKIYEIDQRGNIVNH